jgi:hypothetical protein
MGINIKPLALLLAMGAIAVDNVQAATLTEGNSQVSIDPLSQAGMSEWSINNQNQAYQQWFWYRPSGAGQGQYSIETGATLIQTPTGTDKLNLKYNYGGNFTIDISYHLESIGGNTATLIQNAGITNLSASTLVLDFYQYNNFNLGGDAGGDYLYIESNSAYQEDGGLFVTEGDVQPPSSFFEGNTVGGPGSTLYRLNNTTELNLNTPALGYDEILSAAETDVTWAFQWHITLNPGEGTDIIKNQNLAITLVPEPSALALGVLALTLLRFARKHPRT